MTNTWHLAEYWAISSTLEAAQAAFMQAGSIGIETDDGIMPEGPPKYFNDQILVKAYFEGQTKEDELLITLKASFAQHGLDADGIEVSEVVQQDWQRNFVLSCTTFKVEPNIFIVPSFEIAEFRKTQPSEFFIEMDPENAFGTGQHETTKLCLTAISSHFSSLTQERIHSLRAVDIGCGSGILAILMKKLFAHQVLATETDESALITAGRNAQKNEVSFDLLLVDEDYCYKENAFDLVVANILAPVLILMAKNIVTACAHGGSIILSGILLDQSAKVIAAYESLGAKFIERKTMNDWCALLFKCVK